MELELPEIEGHPKVPWHLIAPISKEEVWIQFIVLVLYESGYNEDISEIEREVREKWSDRIRDIAREGFVNLARGIGDGVVSNLKTLLLGDI